MIDDRESEENLALDRLEQSTGTWVVRVTAVVAVLLLMFAAYLFSSPASDAPIE